MTHAISSAEAKVQPASDRDLLNAIRRVVDMALAFEIKCDAEKVAIMYRQMLAAIPADLLQTGIELVLTAKTDSFRVPLPGEIWKVVQAEYGRRKAAVDRLKTAKLIGDRRGWPDPGQPAIEYVPKKALDDLMDGVRKTLSDADAAFRTKGRKARGF